jgi:hypothetical protein
MPLPHFKSIKEIENNLVYTNRYSAIFLFSDDTYEYLNTELIYIDIDEKNSDRKINLKIVETFDTPFNFGDVECIIIDVHSATGDIKVRKIFDVDFNSYHQKYGNESNKFKDELSIIDTCFEIKDIQILQDTDLINFEAFIRDRKIQKLIE